MLESLRHQGKEQRQVLE
ncbi:unnamed protein product [Amaranthus hypochondriacus]